MIQIDFDGTLTVNNIGLEIMTYCSKDPEESKKIQEDYDRGLITLEECIEDCWDLVPLDAEELALYAADHFVSRGSITDFLDALNAAGKDFVVASLGNPYYIYEFTLGHPLITGSYLHRGFTGDTWKVIIPSRFKERVSYRIEPDVYIGDSSSDNFAALSVLDNGGKVFAVRGKNLSKLLTNLGKPHETFETLEELLGLVLK